MKKALLVLALALLTGATGCKALAKLLAKGGDEVAEQAAKRSDEAAQGVQALTKSAGKASDKTKNEAVAAGAEAAAAVAETAGEED